MSQIRIAIVGLGNCASSLIQGIEFYRGKSPKDLIGLMHPEIGSYKPSDIEVVADCMQRLSQLLVDFEDVMELDMNPIIVYPKGEGCKVADVRIVVK